ncbi:MAG: D-aminoacylase [Pseudomonadota bacterium]|nr:D-aminoacylase [Pseudomonadota bacterium]
MAAEQSKTCDLILVGGDVVDGTGAPRRRADVAVRDDRILAVGDLADWHAGQRVDVRGQVVAPGFIDVHTHDDYALLAKPDMDMKVSQGVTSVVVGNCGFSLAPLTFTEMKPGLALLGDEQAFRFPKMSQFMDAVDDAPPALNAVFLVGHSTLRFGVLDRTDRPATNDEIKVMRDRLEEGLKAGASGLSTGLFYDPAKAAPTREVIEIGQVLKAYGARYVTHMRDEAEGVLDSLEETFEIGRECDSRAIVSHHKVQSGDEAGLSTHTLACIDHHAAHQPVGFDVYPYAAGSTILKADMFEKSKRILITWSKAIPEAGGRDLHDIAAEMGVDIYEAAERLQPAGAIYFSMHEEDVQRILSHPNAMIGSDGLPFDAHPHPRLWGTFPRVLGHYARDLGLFSLEEAVRRMTSLSAMQFDLAGRGTVAEGHFADLVVFDPDKVIDTATFEKPIQAAAGIAHVFVNGREVWRDGPSTGARPGRALRNGQAAA